MIGFSESASRIIVKFGTGGEELRQLATDAAKRSSLWPLLRLLTASVQMRSDA